MSVWFQGADYASLRDTDDPVPGDPETDVRSPKRPPLHSSCRWRRRHTCSRMAATVSAYRDSWLVCCGQSCVRPPGTPGGSDEPMAQEDFYHSWLPPQSAYLAKRRLASCSSSGVICR